MKKRNANKENQQRSQKKPRIEVDIAMQDVLRVAEVGDLEGLKAIMAMKELSAAADKAEVLNYEEEIGKTALYLAMGCGSAPFVSWLVSDNGGRKAGFNKILARTANGETALHIAAQQGHLEAMQALIEGIENGEREELLNAVDDRNYSVLHYASEENNAPIIAWLLSDARAAGFNNVVAETKYEETALHIAAKEGSSDAFLALLEGSDAENGERAELLNAVSGSGCTVLHYALEYGCEVTVRWLLSEQGQRAGFNRDNLFALTTENEESVLHFSTHQGFSDCFDTVVDACKNTAERLRLFLGKDNIGWTVFHHAVARGKADIIAHILCKYPEESQMIINARDNRGMTAIHRSILNGVHQETLFEWGHLLNDETKLAVVAALLGDKNKKKKKQSSTDVNVGLKLE